MCAATQQTMHNVGQLTDLYMALHDLFVRPVLQADLKQRQHRVLAGQGVHVKRALPLASRPGERELKRHGMP